MLRFCLHVTPCREIARSPLGIKTLGLWFGLLVFFFSPDFVHAEFLDRLELLHQLRQGHYQALELILKRQEHLYQEKKIPEEHVETAYLAFANSAADLEERLTEWVQQPGSTGTAQLARGLYYWNVGWKARGFRYSADTPNERVRGMEEFLSLAWKDLHIATSQKPKSGIPHAFLISIAMSLGDRMGINHYSQSGLGADPRSFIVRWKHLWSLTPWWSGLSEEASIEASQTFLSDQVIPHVKNNSTLKPLLGFPDFIRAEMFKRHQQREKAIPFYESALSHGRYYYYSLRKGQNLYFLGQSRKSLEVLSSAINERPQMAEAYSYQALALEDLDRFEEALTQHVKAIELDALDPNYLRRYAWRLSKQHRPQDAEQALAQALTYGSYDHAILGNLGRLHLADLHDPTEALPYLQKATRLKPDKAWYWLNYGWALHELADCQAIEALEQYIWQCRLTGGCTSGDMEWAQKTSQRMIWKEGCWREHPALKFLSRLVEWLPRL